MSFSHEIAVQRTAWWLRIMGASICCAIVPVFFPFSWMAQIHGALGLGEMPADPIARYLARSLSAMYFVHGCFVLALSTNVRGYLPLIRLVGYLNLVLAPMLLAIGVWAQMPTYWICLESPPIAFAGSLLLWLAHQVGRTQPE